MIKIYEYLETDINQIKFNHWGRSLKNSKNLKKIKENLKRGHSFTIFDEKPVAILSFFEYDKDRYYGYIIADEDFAKNPKYAIKMRWLIKRVADEFSPKRVETISEDAEKLNRWHEFLGFKLEKQHCWQKKDVQYNLWSMEWE
jgi:hypothetical protein